MPHGEWRLWVYMCVWRLDKDNIPFFGSEDPREKIEQNLSELELQELDGVTLLTAAFDMKFHFKSNIDLWLFSCNTVEDKQWKFFTPDQNVFIAGPSTNWSYKSIHSTD